MDPEAQELINSQRKCSDCANCVNPGDFAKYCEATQLSEVLDDLRGQNKIALCESARDFKCACGHSAKWFVAREGA